MGARSGTRSEMEIAQKCMKLLEHAQLVSHVSPSTSQEDPKTVVGDSVAHGSAKCKIKNEVRVKIENAAARDVFAVAVLTVAIFRPIKILATEVIDLTAGKPTTVIDLTGD